MTPSICCRLIRHQTDLVCAKNLAGEWPALSKHRARRMGHLSFKTGFLDFAPLMASFPGFEAPVAQLDRVYDFGS